MTYTILNKVFFPFLILHINLHINFNLKLNYAYFVFLFKRYLITLFTSEYTVSTGIIVCLFQVLCIRNALFFIWYWYSFKYRLIPIRDGMFLDYM